MPDSTCGSLEVGLQNLLAQSTKRLNSGILLAGGVLRILHRGRNHRYWQLYPTRANRLWLVTTSSPLLLRLGRGRFVLRSNLLRCSGCSTSKSNSCHVDKWATRLRNSVSLRCVPLIFSDVVVSCVDWVWVDGMLGQTPSETFLIAHTYSR